MAAPANPSRRGSSSRFWIVVALFAGLNAAGWWWAGHEPAPDPGELRVESISPEGEAPLETSIVVRFDREVALSPTDPLPPPDGLIRLLPDVVGRSLWRDARTLVFEPADPLPRATSFSVFVSGKLGALSGLRFEAPPESKFWTPRLELLSVEQTGFTSDMRASVELTFSDAVSPGDLREHLALLGEGDRDIPFELLTDRVARILEVRALEPSPVLVARVDEELRGIGGPLGLISERRVPVPLTFRLRVLWARSWPVFRGAPSVQLAFSEDVEEATALQEHIGVEPALPFTVERTGRGRLRLDGDFEPGRTYSVTVRSGLAGTGGSVLTEAATFQVAVPDRTSRLTLRDSHGVLASSGHGRVPLESANIRRARARLFRVPANNLVHYFTLGRRWWSESSFLDPAGEAPLVIDAAPNEFASTAIDLRSITDDIRGLWRLDVQSTEPEGSSDSGLICATDLGLAARWGVRGLSVWATSLVTGRPASGARIDVLSRNNQTVATATTDDDGLVHFEGDAVAPDVDGARAPIVILATRDGDLAYLRLDEGTASDAAFDVRGRSYTRRGYEAYAYTDRGVYRPGETVHVHAIVRDRDLAAPGEFPIELDVLRPDRKSQHRAVADLSPGGSASWTVPLSVTARTGRHRAVVRIPGTDAGLGEVSFLVEDFVPDRLRASIRVLDEPKQAGYALGDVVSVEVSGQLLAGLPAAGAEADGSWKLHQRTFSHSEWPGFLFAGFVPRDERDVPVEPPPLTGDLGLRHLDGAGVAGFEIPIPEVVDARPLDLVIDAEVRDASGRPVAARTSVRVHPVDAYFGLRLPNELEAGSPYEIECAEVRPDGKPGPRDSGRLVVEQLEWVSAVRKSSSGQYSYESEERATEILGRDLSFADGRATAPVTFPRPGRYRIRITDPDARTGTEMRVAVSRGGWVLSSSAGDGADVPQRLDMDVLDRSPRPGDDVRVSVLPPFPGTMLLTVETDRVLWSDVVRVETSPAVVTVRVPAVAEGNVFVAATLVRPLGESANGGPETEAPPAGWPVPLSIAPVRARGVARLWVDRHPEALHVALRTPDHVLPESRITIAAEVTDADGAPVEAEVALALVDEGILTRTGHATPDPWRWFYGARGVEVSQIDAFDRILPEVPLEWGAAIAGGDGDGGGGGEDGGRLLSPVNARRFDSFALAVGFARTDAEGHLFVDIDLPRFTGEARLMAIAHRGPRFGAMAKPIVVRGPLQLEVGLPRFLAVGDRFRSSVDAINTTEEREPLELAWRLSGPLGFDEPDVDVDVAVAAAGDLADASLSPAAAVIGEAETAGAMARTVRRETSVLGPRGARRFDADLRAADGAGVASVVVEGALGDATRTETLEIAVRPASPPVRRAESGRVTKDEPLELTIPDEFLVGTARHRFVVSPLPGIEHLGPLSQLVGYPYGCLEQTTSKVFPLLWLPDLAALLDLQYGDATLDEDAAASVHRFVSIGIDRILSMQSPSGWLASWPSGRRRWAWGSVYAAHFLVEARRAGYEIADSDMDALFGSLRELARSTEEPLVERAYATFVLALAADEGAHGLVEPLEARVDEAAESSMESVTEARFLLGASWAALGDREKALRRLGTDLPPPSEVRERGGALRSPVRETALLLGVLVDVDPENARIPPLLARLLAARRGGHWGTTQENAFALLALGKYARLRQEKNSTYTALVRVAKPGDDAARPVLLTATDERTFDGDLSGCVATATVDGEGVLFWYLESGGVPTGASVAEVDEGLAVRRRVLDARGEPIDPSVGIGRGDLVQIELVLDASRVVDNAAIVDLLPAGLEVINPRLDGFLAETVGGPVFSLAPEHVEIRDDRVLLFLDRVPARRGVYRYVARAVTFGDFAWPPVSAECLYDAGIRSVSGAGRLVVSSAR